MSDIKIGDVVTVYLGFDRKARGVVRVYLDKLLEYGVDVFKGLPNRLHSCKLPEIMPDKTGWWTDKSSIRKAENYKLEEDGIHVGDRIKTISSDYLIKKGLTGTVVRFNAGLVGVRFDRSCNFTGHNLNGHIGENSGYYIEKSIFTVTNAIMGKEPQLVQDTPTVKDTSTIEQIIVDKIRKLFDKYD